VSVLIFVLYAVQPMPKGDHVLNFSDAEDMINDKDLVYVALHGYCIFIVCIFC